MRKLLLICLAMLLLFPALAWPEGTAMAPQGSVVLALRNPWPRLPSPQEITVAFNDYKSRRPNVNITSEPRKMHAPWESDALTANKVVFTIRIDYQSSPSQFMAVVLKYDFQSDRFRFAEERVRASGIMRLEPGRSTVSNLEPQDLSYLQGGWIAAGPEASSQAAARPAPKPSEPGQFSINDAVALAVNDYIGQFEDDSVACFGRVVKLGDPETYSKAIAQLTISTDPGNVDKNALAQLATYKPGWFSVPQNELRIPFDVPLSISVGTAGGPAGGALTYPNLRTLYHEAVHQIESLHNDLRDESVPGANRNAQYLNNLVDALQKWSVQEQQVIHGTRTPQSAGNTFRRLEEKFAELDAEFGPELRKMKVWAGVDIDFKKILDLYLSGACDEGMREAAQSYLRGDTGESSEPGIADIPDNAPESGGAAPAQGNSSAPADTGHIVYAKVYDKQTGQPVAGAAFTVLRPGITTGQYLASDFDSNLVAAMGVSDDSGMVVLSQSLQNGQTYSVMVAHASYKVLRFESLSIAATSPDPLKVTAKLSLK